MTEIWNLSTLCRCCHRDGSFKSLNMPCEDENGDEIYEALIKETFCINITQPPEHLDASHTICDNCITRLKDATQFKQQVLACEEKFKVYCTNEEFINKTTIDDNNIKCFNDYDVLDDSRDVHQGKELVKQALIGDNNIEHVIEFNSDGCDDNSDIHQEITVCKKRTPSKRSMADNIKLAKNDLLKYSSNCDDGNLEKRRDKIIFLHKQGHGKRIIAKALNVSRNTVKLWIERHIKGDDLGDHRRFNRGITRVTPEQRTSMWQYYEESGLTPTRQFAKQFNVTMSTIRNHLNTMGLHYKNTKKVILTDRQKSDRLNFAHYYLNFDWSNVIFSDEKSFYLDDTGNLNLCSEDNVARNKNETGNTNLCSEVASNKNSNSICVNLWGWMSLASVGELTEMPLRVKSRDYICVLDEVMLPTVRIIYPQNEVPNFYYIQDNCPIHTSKLVTNWFKVHRNEVNLIHWPANSPDLNPIGDLFGLLCEMWENKMGKSRDGFVQYCHQIWENLRASNICSGLIGSMHTRLQEVITNGGGYTRF